MNKKRTVRVRNGFSDRNMLRPIPKEMQLEDFSKETRTALFIALKNIIDDEIRARDLSESKIAKIIVENMFNEQYDEYSDYLNNVFEDISKIFQTEPYHVLLTVIEYLCNLFYESRESFLKRHNYDHSVMPYYIDIREKMNEALENEYVGYRFLNKKIAPITNENEIEEIKNATQTPYERVNESISKSIQYISETGNKDFKNAIKESITALEELMNIILNTSGLVLGNAIEQYSQKYEINNDLRESIKSMYRYASNVNGIRHGNNKDNDEVTFEEAKLVLLFCSSTINYFCSKKTINSLELEG